MTLPKAIWDDSQATCEQFRRDWTGRFGVTPRAVLFPRSTQEVSQALAYCHHHGFSVVPVGGGTGLVGGAVAIKSSELLLSLRKLNFIDPADLRARTVRVGAGAITLTVNESVEKHQLMWPIRFGAEGSSQIGGNLSTNVGGMQVLRYGMARRWVEAITVVLMNGSTLSLGGLPKDNAGYSLKELFLGSEGTLGVITEATLRLTPSPRRLSLGLFAVDRLEQGLEILARGHRQGYLHACEFFSRRCAELVQQHLQDKTPLPKANYYILLEMVTRDFPAEAFAEFEGILATSHEQREALWALREHIPEAVVHEGAVHKNDIALPLDKLPVFCQMLETGHFYGKAPVYLYGHLGDGNVHVNVIGKRAPSQFYERCHEIDSQVYRTVQEMGGTISAEHGIGQLKRAFLHYSRSEAEIRLYRQLKRLFDPKGLLNPGKLLNQTDTAGSQ